MKYLYHFKITLFLLALSWTTAGYGQNNIDANRMNRDINIMENILEEMFKIQSSHAGTYVVSGDLFRNRGGIRGTYLSGYGVIFTISSQSSPFVFEFDDDDNGKKSYSYSFVYKGDEDTDNKVDEESIINRIQEFLRDYGSTIGQLNENDKIMVIYGANRSDHPFFVFSGEEKEVEEIPTISVVVTKNDLDAYRAGRVSAPELKKRFSVAKAPDSDDRQLDMEVMANIFETAFKETEGKGFRIRGQVNHLKLDNFGALFFFDVSYSDAHVFSLRAAPRIEILRSMKNENKAKIQAELEEKTEEEIKEREKREAEREENIKQAYEQFKTQLKEYVVDYGRTLSSVKPDQYVMASITLQTRVEDVPERIDVQIKKSVLEAVDKGSMSREEALKQVVIREY